MTYKPNMNDHWKLRALCLTRTNQTMMGAVLLAILGHVPPRRPYYKGLAEITKDGVVVAKLYSRGNLLPRKTAVCHVNDYTGELRRIADVCEMDDKERGELFSEARKWIERDHRAKSRLD